ncbi:MAG TPA: biopolymer transporter ExbD [Polyangia bacterium]|nr:biopolymer transporter ExbD [Polyangia bacterium]
MASGGKLDEENIISDINITPLVDVMLVLLVIFMVTATYIVAQSIPVDLPEAGTGEEVVTTLAITITEDGTYYLDGQRVDEARIKQTISRTRQDNPDVRVIIAADKRIEHGKVVHVIDLVRKLGVAKFAINIDAEEE